MRHSSFKDLKNRQLFCRVEQNRIVYKYIIFSFSSRRLSVKQRHLFYYKYFRRINAQKYSFFTKILNKCVFTNRNKKTFSSFKMSRIKLKDLLSFGAVPGYQKSVW